MADVTLKALTDLVSAGKSHKAGSTFTASEQSASQALAFGLAEVVGRDDGPVISQRHEAKSTPKRSSRKVS